MQNSSSSRSNNQHENKYTEPDRKKVGYNLEFSVTGDNFLNRTPILQALRSTINKWDLMKLNTLCINRANGSLHKGKIFTNYKSNKRLISPKYMSNSRN